MVLYFFLFEDTRAYFCVCLLLQINFMTMVGWAGNAKEQLKDEVIFPNQDDNYVLPEQFWILADFCF